MPKGWVTRCAPSAPHSPAVERVAAFYPEVAFTVADERPCHVPLPFVAVLVTIPVLVDRGCGQPDRVEVAPDAPHLDAGELTCRPSDAGSDGGITATHRGHPQKRSHLPHTARCDGSKMVVSSPN
jgi:hypothetical protein